MTKLHFPSKPRLLRYSDLCRKLAFASCFLIFPFVNNAFADLIVNVDNNMTFDTSAVDGFDTFGNEMSGIIVEVTFGDGTTETRIWEDLGGNKGGVSGVTTPDWSLEVDGHTHPDASGNAPWILTNNSGKTISMIEINARAGEIAFDLESEGNSEGTLGSNIGHTFSEGSPVGTWRVDTFLGLNDDGDVTALYSEVITVGGNSAPAIPDLYGILKLTFNSAVPSGQTFHFDADTDFIGSRAIPEPSSLVVLASIGIGIGIRRKRVSVS